ncbi:predicted protein [Histoplasma capsulatum H143]|uniref:Uncharacterized protein n=1 Tax=Ajellomyces capsulatus (strain H143) TaxID=544712 RepID=C6HNC2_AJECH|nr:predicted protein [Histoplasma capsulatum H143]
MSRLGISSSMRLENRRLDGGLSCRPQACQLALLLHPEFKDYGVYSLRSMLGIMVKTLAAFVIVLSCEARFRAVSGSPTHVRPARGPSLSPAQAVRRTPAQGLRQGRKLGLAGWLAGELPSRDDASLLSSMAIHVSIPIVWCRQA